MYCGSDTQVLPNYFFLNFDKPWVDIDYIGVFQFNEAQGQIALNSLPLNLNFTLGSRPLQTDSNDPVWERVSVLKFSDRVTSNYRQMEVYPSQVTALLYNI